jgi:hypothetical protein
MEHIDGWWLMSTPLLKMCSSFGVDGALRGFRRLCAVPPQRLVITAGQKKHAVELENMYCDIYWTKM